MFVIGGGRAAGAATTATCGHLHVPNHAAKYITSMFLNYSFINVSYLSYKISCFATY